MVLVVSSVASKDVLERWTFDVLTDRAAAAGQCAAATRPVLVLLPVPLRLGSPT